jgi:hypothetical protein
MLVTIKLFLKNIDMKKIFLLFFLVIAANIVLRAQTPSEQLAEKISRKMKDSLSLTDAQKMLLYNINMNISNQKLALRQEVTNVDSLRSKTQRVENLRDSFYRQVLTEEQFTLYKQKKSRLINNN